METLDRLLSAAAADQASYPQYDGYYVGDEWRLVEVTARVETKMGLAFEPGERAPGKRGRGQFIDGWFVYSARNKIDTFVRADTVKEVA